MNDKLALVVKDSGLEVESPKAKMLLEQFSDYFEIAADWEKKAAIIVVTDASQTVEMKMAREGRLFLREKRIAIEKKRKELKEQALREGKAIDGMANILKAFIVPIEEYLGKQEKFVEIKAAEEAERLRIEAEKKAEEDRIAKEKAEAEEQERVRLENERLKAEATKRERLLAIEKVKVEAEKLQAAKKLKAEQDRAKVEADRIEVEREAEREKAAIEKTKAEVEACKREQEVVVAEKKAQEEKSRAAAKLKAEQDKAKFEKAKSDKERANLEAKLKTQITCPHCGKKLYPDGSLC